MPLKKPDETCPKTFDKCPDGIKKFIFLLLACFYTTINFFALYQVCKFALTCNKFEEFAPCELSVM